MSIAQWSTTAGSNATAADNINWAEGQAPSTVNNSARQLMADNAAWYRNSAEWIDRNDTVAFSSGTIISFTSQDVTSIYNVGRRIKVTASTPGTLYGVITASSTSGANTLVTISWDSTAVLSNESITDVAIGIVGNSTGTQSLDAKNIARINQFGVPTGTMLMYGSTTAPTNFLLCDGTAYSRTTYSDLFGVVGTSFGSTSTGTFKVPDMRGRTGVGIDSLGGTSANVLTSTAADTLGGTLGNESTNSAGSISGSIGATTLTESQMPSHTHDIGFGGGGSAARLFDETSANSSFSQTQATGGGGSHTHSNSLSFSGSSASIVQPSIALNYIIRV